MHGTKEPDDTTGEGEDSDKSEACRMIKLGLKHN